MNDSQNRTAALTKDAACSSPLQTARAVLGQPARDVVMYIGMGTETLDWLESIFSAIEMLHEKGGGEVHIKRLAGIGRFVAGDIAELIGSEQEKILASIEAAKAQEEGAA